MHKYKYTQDEVEKFPIYGLPEEEKLTFINDAVGRHRDQIKDAADLKFVLRMVSAAYFPSELEEAGRTLAQEIEGFTAISSQSAVRSWEYQKKRCGRGSSVTALVY